MNNFAKLLGVAAAVASGCVTSEPIDLRTPDAEVLPITAPTGAGGNPIPTGQAGAGAVAGASGGAPGAAGGGAAGSGAAGSTVGSSGAAGVSGSAGTGAPIDAGANDARPRADAGAGADAGPGASSYAATWTDIYNKMLNNTSYASNCTGGGCHNPGTQKGLDLSTQAKGYTTIKGKLVVGNPGASNVVSQLSGGKMPQARPKMPAADLNVIKAWIMAGALNN